MAFASAFRLPALPARRISLPYGLHHEAVAQLATAVKSQRLLQADEYGVSARGGWPLLVCGKIWLIPQFYGDSDGFEQTVGFICRVRSWAWDALQHGRSVVRWWLWRRRRCARCRLARATRSCAPKFPALQMQMMRILGKEIASDHEQIVLLGHRSAKERVATFLLMLSRRYGALGFSGTAFNLSMRRQDIANFLGLTIENGEPPACRPEPAGDIRISSAMSRLVTWRC